MRESDISVVGWLVAEMIDRMTLRAFKIWCCRGRADVAKAVSERLQHIGEREILPARFARKPTLTIDQLRKGARWTGFRGI